jgi:hypothetical protein
MRILPFSESKGCSPELVEVLPRLKPDGFAGSNADFRPGARISSNTGFARADVEDAKSAQFNAVSGGKSLLEAFKDGFDGGLGFDAGQSGTLDHLVYDVLLNQWLSPRNTT